MGLKYIMGFYCLLVEKRLQVCERKKCYDWVVLFRDGSSN